MTTRSERSRARLVVDTSARLLEELRVGLEEVRSVGSLSAARLRELSPAERTTLLAFLKRFENAVEAGRRLFRVTAFVVAENFLQLSMYQILVEAERAGVLLSATGWREVMRGRDVIAHEYSMSPEEASQALSNAVTSAQAAVELLDHALAAMSGPPFAQWLRED